MRTEKAMIGRQSMNTETREFLSTQDIARMFSVSKQTVRAWMRSGQLPFVQFNQVIRIKREDVQAFIERSERERSEMAQ